MSSNILIRHTEPSDLNDIYELQQGKRFVWGTLRSPYPSIDFARNQIENPRAGVVSLVAEIDGKVIGRLGLTPHPRPRRKHTATIGMGVHDDYAGRGAGTALMAACVDLADNWLIFQ